MLGLSSYSSRCWSAQDATTNSCRTTTTYYKVLLYYNTQEPS